MVEQSEAGPQPEEGAQPGDAASTSSIDEAVLENSNQFYRWHSELESARTLETEEKYQQYADSLRSQLTVLEQLQAQVRQ